MWKEGFCLGAGGGEGGQLLGTQTGEGRLASTSSSVSIKAQVAARVGLTGSPSESEGGAGRLYPAARKKERLRAPPALHMLSCLIYLDLR